MSVGDHKLDELIGRRVTLLTGNQHTPIVTGELSYEGNNVYAVNQFRQIKWEFNVTLVVGVVRFTRIINDPWRVAASININQSQDYLY